jgi:predicted MFS family arabinose efflux permease
MMAQINYKMFFTNIRAMTAIISSIFAMIFMLFYEPVLTNYLGQEYNLSSSYFGYVLAIGCFTYAFSSPFVGILCSKVKRRYVTLGAFIFCGCSLFIFGPS